jgi:hypothetical protein
MTANMCIAEGSGGSNEIKVFLNGERLEFDVNPYIKNSRTLVPFRKIFEAFGLEVQWNPTNKTVLATGKGTEIYLTINSTEGIVNSEEQKLDAPPEIKDSRTFVPLRFIGESIGADVKWEASTRTVNITYEAASTDVKVSSTPSPSKSGASRTPIPTRNSTYIPVGSYKVGDISTYGDLSFSIDKVDLNLEKSYVYITGKTNSEQELQFSVYTNTGSFIFITSSIEGEKEGGMYKYTGYNYLSDDSNIKDIYRIEVRIRAADDSLVRVADYKTN